MKNPLLVATLFLTSLLTACAHQMPSQPPPTAKIDKVLTEHGDSRVDSYYWLKERENPKLIEHLNKENAYTAAVLAPASDVEEKLFSEMKMRVKEEDSSYPIKDGEFYYSHRYEKSQQYPVHIRQKDSLKAPAEILIDGPALAKGTTYFHTQGPNISPSQHLLAYAVDTQGRRFYTVFFKDLRSGLLLDNKIENVTGNLVWAQDNETVFYTAQNFETLRSEKIYRYNIRTRKTDLIYFEKDETFGVYLGQSLSKKFIYIASGSTLTSEYRYLPSDKPFGKFKIFTPRVREHEYSVTDDGKRFYILSNKNAKNRKIMTTSLSQTNQKHWKPLIPHRSNIFIDEFLVFSNHLVVAARHNGLSQLMAYDKSGKNPFSISFQDPAYMAAIGSNRELNTDNFRYDYESMRQPDSVYDFDLKNHVSVLRKQKEVPTYNPELYKIERIFIKARDGTEVPISLLMKKDFVANAEAPLLVYGYGSYGYSLDAEFSSSIFSLINRGYVYALIHVRGGAEMGRQWYDQGRTMNKKSSFNDFIDATEGLLSLKYADPKRVFAMGGSAGGLLMGAVVNQRPDLYRGVVAQVPFVDVLTTMLDETIPLTTSEYDEWGNPHKKEAYDYIKSYSPYDNVVDNKYPSILATTGLHDSQVQYWEPAKWVAKLRDHNKSPDSVILLKTNMGAGHGGASGRFDRLKEVATNFSFMLLVDSWLPKK